MKTIKTIMLMCGGLACVFLFAASLCVSAQADVITVTISGSGSGSLGGQAFAPQAFEWVLTYDTTNTYSGSNPSLSLGQVLFLNPLSSISLHDTHPAPLILDQAQGVYLDSNTGLYMAPVLMSAGDPTTNILTITGTPAWNGLSAPYQSTAITGADFSQFVNITTSGQGLLTMDNTSSVTSIATAPEPSGLTLLAIAGAGIALVARSRRKRLA